MSGLGSRHEWKGPWNQLVAVLPTNPGLLRAEEASAAAATKGKHPMAAAPCSLLEFATGLNRQDKTSTWPRGPADIQPKWLRT